MKFLTLNSIRILSILLTLINISAFVYFGNLYNIFLSIAFLCVVFQIVIFIFYLLFHIYYVWINELLIKVQHQQDLNAVNIQNVWKSLEDKEKLISTAIKESEEKVNSKVRLLFENLLETFNNKETEAKSLFTEIKEELTNRIDKFSDSLNSKEIERKAFLSDIKETLFKKITSISEIIQLQDTERAELFNSTKESFAKSLKEISLSSEDIKESLHIKINVLTDDLKELLQFLHDINKNISLESKEVLTKFQEHNEKLRVQISDTSNKINEQSDNIGLLIEAKVDYLLNDSKGRDKSFKELLSSNVEILNSGVEKINSSLLAFEESQMVSFGELSDEQKKIAKELIPSLTAQLEEVFSIMAKADQLSHLMTKINEELKESDQKLIDSIRHSYNEVIEKTTTDQEKMVGLITKYKEQLNETSENLNHTIKNDIVNKLLEIVQAQSLKEYISSTVFEAHKKVTDQVNQYHQANSEEIQKVQKFILGSEEKIIEEFTKNLTEKMEFIHNQSSAVSEEQLLKIHHLTDEIARQSVQELLKVTASQQSQQKVHELIAVAIESFNEQYAKLNLGLKESKEIISKVAHGTTEVSDKMSKLPSTMNFEGKNIELKKFITSGFDSTYERIDSLFSIHNLLKLNSPLPVMHEWRISSDFATYLVEVILNQGEGNVIDIGSGVSTILAAYAVKKNGTGKVIALEHSKEYFNKTTELVKVHKLEKYCQLFLCPLKEYTINSKKWLWYDISKIQLPKDVILMNVDGPPGHTQAMARYPAVPLLKHVINKHTKILLDDGKREDERKIAEAWEEDLNLKKVYINNFKGLYELSK